MIQGGSHFKKPPAEILRTADKGGSKAGLQFSSSYVHFTSDCFISETFFVNHQHYKSSLPFDLKSKIMILNKKSDVSRGSSMIVIFDESTRNK